MGCCGSVHGEGAPRPVEDAADPQTQEQKDGFRQQRESYLSQCLEASRRVSAADFAHPAGVEIGADSVQPKSFGIAGTSSNAVVSGFEESSSSQLPRTMPSSSTVGLVTKSRNSQLDYASPEQTVIFFDWDDTLCPSTWFRRQAQLDAEGRIHVKLDDQLRDELRTLAEQVVPLLQMCSRLGKVVLVTNAKRPWVDTSSRKLLPLCREVLKDIPVMYALELVQDEYDITKPLDDNNELLTETKARAMRAAVRQFYSRYEGQSWKNVVSIGDALFEHDAIKQVTAERPTPDKKCRTKTVKLLEGPTIAGMVVQLTILENWIHKIVQLDDDVDIDLSADEETVNSWVAQFASVGNQDAQVEALP